MPRIADYFCSTTKEIKYVRNHFHKVEEVNGEIFMTRYVMGDNLPPDSTPEEKRLEFIREMSQYVNCSLRDNKLLIRALEEIEKAFLSDQWDFSQGFLIEMLTGHKAKEQKSHIISDLVSLLMLFQCYKVLVWKEPSLPPAYKKKIDEETTYYTNPHATLEDKCREYLEFVTTMMIEVSTNMYVDEGKLVEVLHAHTLTDALFYQLLMHIAAGEDGLKGYRLAECQSCHQTYMKIHGNQKFCEQCSSNSERVRAYKQRKKEALKHAQESHP